jgi:hypothetical protein
MTTDTLRQLTLGLTYLEPVPHPSGSVRRGRTQVLRNLGGSLLRCTSGSLWVTVEGDRQDHVLTQGDTLAIPNLGKVILSGAGSYQV